MGASLVSGQYIPGINQKYRQPSHRVLKRLSQRYKKEGLLDIPMNILERYISHKRYPADIPISEFDILRRYST